MQSITDEQSDDILKKHNEFKKKPVCHVSYIFDVGETRCKTENRLTDQIG